MKWIVKDFLPAGLIILGGDPKCGKSWLALEISLAVASGRKACGNFETEEGQVLFLALEDSWGRLQHRTGKLLNGRTAPRNLVFAIEWPTMPEAAQDIRTWVKDQPNPSLVVIDTFMRIRPSAGKYENVYERDYKDYAAIQHLAEELNIAIILVTHTNKGEHADYFRKITGSQGVTAASDVNWVLETNRETMEATLSMAGREISDRTYKLRMNQETCAWEFVGNIRDIIGQQTEADIMAALKDAGGRPLTQRQISREVGKSQVAICKHMPRLIEQGFVEKSVSGGYLLKPGLVFNGR